MEPARDENWLMARREKKSRSLEERREAYRCAVAGPRSWGRLKGTALDLPVEVLDESVGGFAVAMEGLCKIELGTLLWLEVEADQIAVRLVNVDLQDVGVERFEGLNLRSRSRLGLKREPDARPWIDHKTPAYAGWARLRRTRIQETPWGLIGAATLFLSGLVVVAYFLTRDLEQAQPFNPLARGAGERKVREIDSSLKLAPDHKWTVDEFTDRPTGPVERIGDDLPRGFGGARSAKKVEDKTVSLQGDEPRGGRLEDTSREPKDKAAGLEQEAAAEEEAALAQPPNSPPAAGEREDWSAENQPRDLVLLAQPELLLRADVARFLELSTSQQAHLRRIASEERTSRVENAQPPTADERLLTRGRLSLAVLTDAQRQQLARLELGESERPPGGK